MGERGTAATRAADGALDGGSVEGAVQAVD
jgi:hypothetical protein